MKLNRKWILILSLVLSVAMATGGTLAYMQDTDSRTNTFTLGNVAIFLTEPKYDSTNDHLLYPGATVDKDPTITNVGKTAAYVWMDVALPNAVAEYIDWTLNANWSELSKVKGTDKTTVTLKYATTLAKGESTGAAFDTITLVDTIPNAVFNALSDEITIDVTACAIEDLAFDSFEEAYDAFYGKEVIEVNDFTTLKNYLAIGRSVKLTDNIVAKEQIVIPAGFEATLDLNGKTLSQEYAQTETYAMILNKGELTITDSLGGGVIDYSDITVYTTDINYASNTIRNEGILNVQGGTIKNSSSENVSDYGYPHAIDVYPGSITNITGGTIQSADYDSIRMFCNSATKLTKVNISGGNIINRVSFQLPNNGPMMGELNISGGTFTTTNEVNANVRLICFGNDLSKMNATISGGTFDKGVKTQDFIGSTNPSPSDWLTIVGNVNVPTIN